MSNFFNFDRGATSNSRIWNYSDPNKDDYSLELIGTVVELSDPMATKFQSSEIDRWKDGNPKRNICITILTQDGQEKDWIFSPGSSRNPSQAMQACRNALMSAGINANSLEELGGMVIGIQTQAAPQGFKYGQGAPRPWVVQIGNAQKSQAYRGTKHIVDEVTEGKQQAPQQAQPVMQQQPQPMMQQPTQMQPMQQAQPVMQQAQPMQMQPQPMMQPMQMQPMQMQQQPQQGMPGAYADSDIPF